MHGDKLDRLREKNEKGDQEKDNEKKNFHCETVNMSLEVPKNCVMPVLVRHTFSDRIGKTYAMLNTSSQGTFLT